MREIRILYITILTIMFSFAPIMAKDLTLSTTVNEVRELKLEDAIAQAQSRNKRLRMQQTNIDFANVDSEDAYYQYYNSWDYGFERAITNYSQAKINEEYEVKYEDTIKEQIAYDIEGQFDSILELEEKYEFAQKRIDIQKQKVSHNIIKEELGLGSKANTKLEKASLETQEKEIESLVQSIDGGYRKLNDAIGGKEERYHLIKENIYTPLEMERSLQGHISYSMNSDLALWKQEESAKLQEGMLTAPGPDGWAPTYTEYQKRKINFQQSMNSVSLSKENKEQQIKEMYENILALEIQYGKMLLDLEEAQRQHEIIEKQHKLGMITSLALQEVELALMQNQIQINSTIRQHNQLKTLFEKSYLGQVK